MSEEDVAAVRDLLLSDKLKNRRVKRATEIAYI
jgi:hypothetical protein